MIWGMYLRRHVRKQDSHSMVDLDVPGGPCAIFLELPNPLPQRTNKVFSEKTELNVKVGVEVLELFINFVLPKEGVEVVQVVHSWNYVDLSEIIRGFFLVLFPS